MESLSTSSGYEYVANDTEATSTSSSENDSEINPNLSSLGDISFREYYEYQQELHRSTTQQQSDELTNCQSNLPITITAITIIK